MRLQIEPNVTTIPLVKSESVNNNVFLAPDFESLLKNGIAAAQNGERERARALLVQVAAIDPGVEDAWMWLASISESPEELLAFLNRVLEINPENERAVEWRSSTRTLLAKTFVQRAVAAYEEGSATLAGQCIDQALGYDADCEMAWFWRASLAVSDDQKIEYLERVLAINEANQDARNAIASIMRSRSHAIFDEAKAAAVDGKRKKAVDLVDEFLESVTDNAEALVLRSHLSLNLDEKFSFLEKALEVDPENAAARSGLDFLNLTFGLGNGTPGSGHHEGTEPAQIQEEVEVAVQPAAETMIYENAVEIDETAVVAVEDEPFDIAEAQVEASTAHTVEELFRPVEKAVDADGLTVESLSPFVQKVENGLDEVDGNEEIPSINVEGESLSPDAEPSYDEVQAEFQDTGFTCPFCMAGNDPQAFECGTCNATLSLSDIESLLSNTRAKREVIQLAVTQMEAEWNLREFSEDELTALGIGHFNLNNFTPGLKYLKEASQLNANNVILSSQVNAIAIRLDEMRRQDEVHESRPVGKMILVVDDSPTVRKLISGKLEKSGHNVVCAVDGVEALERLDEGLPDLVLLDITMPRMDGYEVCKQIRLNPAAKDLPVVMISGKDGFFDKVRGRLAGTTGYVTKPFGPETLMKALETYLLPEAVEAS